MIDRQDLEDLHREALTAESESELVNLADHMASDWLQDVARDTAWSIRKHHDDSERTFESVSRLVEFSRILMMAVQPLRPDRKDQTPTDPEDVPF